MHSRRNLIWSVLALIIAIEGVVLLLRSDTAPSETPIVTENATSTSAQFANAGLAIESTTASPFEIPAEETHSTPVTPAQEPAPTPQTSTAPTAAPEPQKPAATAEGMAMRISSPYTVVPQSFATVNSETRAALVNILCSSAGSIRPISGSGVIIDPRGIILTNAHVAQYVLLAQSGKVDLSCSVRTGSPARPAWKAGVLYIPQVWVNAHVNDLNASQTVTGSGEHDYALLYISESIDGTPLSGSEANFSYLPTDSREAIAFLGDEVIVAGYPAEFLGVAAENSLYQLASITKIKQLLTFGSGSVDLISLGSVIEAQSGSSGGAITNPWGYLVGVITTTSAGVTVDKRDLRALTLSYINRDMKVQSGSTLDEFLDSNLLQKAEDFSKNQAPNMLEQYLAHIQATQ
ncbi:hypothetical protein C4585_00350 [Candidatus Parcubacteria bacterium]|nr:MAG: hypothetical protein C4585_00350 [Candidatus Parcubacteria bacterium]